LIFQIVCEELKMTQSGKQAAPGEEDRARIARANGMVTTVPGLLPQGSAPSGLLWF
jgi:hypothetical protein